MCAASIKVYSLFTKLRRGSKASCHSESSLKWRAALWHPTQQLVTGGLGWLVAECMYTFKTCMYTYLVCTRLTSKEWSQYNELLYCTDTPVLRAPATILLAFVTQCNLSLMVSFICLWTSESWGLTFIPYHQWVSAIATTLLDFELFIFYQTRAIIDLCSIKKTVVLH